MNIERLIRLAELLEADAANPTGLKFDLGFWAAPVEFSGKAFSERDKLVEGGLKLTEVSKTIVNCNTAACAVGLAVLSEAFADQGLTGTINECNGELIPKFEHNDGWHAVQYFFDINGDDAERLFSSGSYSVSKGAAAEEAVALRIRRYVNGENIHPFYADEDED